MIIEVMENNAAWLHCCGSYLFVRYTKRDTGKAVPKLMDLFWKIPLLWFCAKPVLQNPNLWAIFKDRKNCSKICVLIYRSHGHVTKLYHYPSSRSPGALTVMPFHPEKRRTCMHDAPITLNHKMNVGFWSYTFRYKKNLNTGAKRWTHYPLIHKRKCTTY